jgi:hypothetical protein
MTSNEVLELYKKGDLISIKDNFEYNILKDKPELYGTRYANNYFKMKLIDLVKFPDDDVEYIVFETEELINDKTLHISMVEPLTFDQIYDYDVGLVDKTKSHFININRVAIDYGYASLSEFLTRFNELKEKYPERML